MSLCEMPKFGIMLTVLTILLIWRKKRGIMKRKILLLILVILMSIGLQTNMVFADTELTQMTKFELLKGGATIHNGDTVSLGDVLTAKYYFSFSSELLEEVVSNNKYGTSYAYDLVVPSALKINEADGTTVPLYATISVEDGPTYSNFILGYLYFIGGKAQYYFASSAALTDLVENYQIEIENVELAFTCKIDDSKLNSSDKAVEIESPLGGSAINLDILERQDVLPQITSKDGIYQEDSRTILWTVNAHSGYPVVAGMQFVDVLDENQVYVTGTFKVDGVVAAVGTVDYDASSHTLTYTPLVAPDANKTLTFTYEADVTSLFTNGTSVNDVAKTVTNSAKWVYTDGSSSAKVGSVYVDAHWLQKEATDIDLDTGIITWKIEVKSNGSGATNVVIYDEMDSNLSYIPNSLSVVGNTVTEANITTPTFSYGSNPNYHGMSFPLNNPLSQDVTITYQTVIAPAYLDNQNETATLDNKVWMTFEWDPYGTGPGTFVAPSIGIGADVPTSLIKKEFKSYNDVDKTIVWSITVNANRVNLEDVTVTDVVPVGQTYIQNSAKMISRNGVSVSNNDYFSEFFDASSPVFSIGSVSGDLGKDTVTFEITTKITDTNFIQYNVKDYIFTNKAILDAKFASNHNPINKEAVATAKLDNEVIKKICAEYNYDTQTFKWEITVNKNHAPMKNVRIEDEIPSNQVFDSSSGVIIERIDGSVDNALLNMDYILNSGTVVFTIGDSTDTIYDTYKITYYTTLNADDATLNLKDNSSGSTRVIKNTAVLKRDTFGNVSSEASQNIQNVLLNKTAGVVDTANGNVTFTININQNRVTLNGTVITDVLPSGLLLDIYTVKLYEASVNPNGSFTQSTEVLSGYTKQYNATTRTLTVTLPSPSNKAYQLVYTTDIVSVSEALINTARMGNDDVVNAANSGVSVSQTAAAAASGVAKGKKGRAQIKIVDDMDATLAIANATFGLYDVDGNLLQEVKTDANGLLVFENLTLNADYVIKQTQEASHYIMDSTTTYPIKATSSTNVVYNGTNYTSHLPEFTNKRSHDWTVEFATVNQYGYPLEGVIFGLYDSSGNEIKRATSDANGLIGFTAPFGAYEVREISTLTDCIPTNAIFDLVINRTDSVASAMHPMDGLTQVTTHVYTQNNTLGRFINGDTHKISSKKNLTLEVDKGLQLLSKVFVDGIQLNVGQYSINASNQLVLIESYLSTLPVGTHRLSLEFADGTTFEIDFFIQAAPSIPAVYTGVKDSITPWLWWIVFAGFAISFFKYRKRECIQNH